MDVKVENGKYVFHLNEETGEVTADRYGEPWLVFDKGTKALISVLHELDAARELLAKAEKRDEEEPLVPLTVERALRRVAVIQTAVSEGDTDAAHSLEDELLRAFVKHRAGLGDQVGRAVANVFDIEYTRHTA